VIAEVNGIRMHYLEWGDARGVPLVWSHGHTSTGFELIQVGQGLADLGYHVFAITYRGHGQTQVANIDFSLSDIADDIAGLLDQRGIQRAVIGGLSLGGGVATTFYENYPERVLAIALEDGGADPVQNRMESIFDRVHHILPLMPATEWSHADRFAAFRCALLPYLSLLQLRPEVAPMFHSFVRCNDSGAWVFHADPSRLLGTGEISFDPARGHELSLLAQSWRRIHPIITYRRLSVPMLIIDPTGDDEFFGGLMHFTPAFKHLQSLHPHLIRHVEYPGTMHAAHPQQPEWFLRDMGELLARVRAQGAESAPVHGRG
jgi:pimeloyl-ACP methyl ester carboxylesterase